MTKVPVAFIRQDGFTLIEAVIAMCILTIGILSMYTVHASSIKHNAKASLLTTASNYGMKKIEDLIETSYASIEDTNGDGETGLDTVTDADYEESIEDGAYTIYWNVAEDVPVEGCKTIRVHVQDNTLRLTNVVTCQYIKEEDI